MGVFSVLLLQFTSYKRLKRRFEWFGKISHRLPPPLSFSSVVCSLASVVYITDSTNAAETLPGDPVLVFLYSVLSFRRPFSVFSTHCIPQFLISLINLSHNLSASTPSLFLPL